MRAFEPTPDALAAALYWAPGKRGSLTTTEVRRRTHTMLAAGDATGAADLAWQWAHLPERTITHTLPDGATSPDEATVVTTDDGWRATVRAYVTDAFGVEPCSGPAVQHVWVGVLNTWEY
jgi:hypothetical protein